MTLVREARSLLGSGSAVLVSIAGPEDRARVVALDPPGELPEVALPLAELPPLAALLGSNERERLLEGEDAAVLARRLGAGEGHDAALLLALRERDAVSHVLVLSDRGSERLAARLELASAFAAGAEAGSALASAAEAPGQTAREAALMRAARSLNDSLDLNRVLVRICEEAARVLDADYANLFLGNAEQGLRVEATYGLPPELIGAEIDTGEGLIGQVVARDEPMLTNDYQGLTRQVRHPLFRKVKSSLAVPMHWDGRLRGGLSVGFFRHEVVTREQLTLLEAFGDLAAAACRNASAHAGLAVAARTDALTGCLNHAALHDTLHRELERCRRTGQPVSLVMVDLDDFKQVNELHGHLAGDEVLRRAGHALRQAVRAYDLVARYGGDEFVVLAIDSDEETAAEVAARAVEGVASSLEELELASAGIAATAGVAEWRPGEPATGLIARADRALLYGKQRGSRGTALRASELPEHFTPVAKARGDADPADAQLSREHAERLRRRTRQLEVVGAVAERLATLFDPAEMAAAVVDELDRSLGHFLTAVLRARTDGQLESIAVRGSGLTRLDDGGWTQPVDSGLIGRAICDRRPVASGEVRSEADYRLVPRMFEVRSEMAAPVWVGGRLWGAIDVEEVRPDAFGEEDVRMLRTLAAQLGTAIRAAGAGQPPAADSDSSSLRQSRSTLAS